MQYRNYLFSIMKSCLTTCFLFTWMMKRRFQAKLGSVQYISRFSSVYFQVFMCQFHFQKCTMFFSWLVNLGFQLDVKRPGLVLHKTRWRLGHIAICRNKSLINKQQSVHFSTIYLRKESCHFIEVKCNDHWGRNTFLPQG